MSDYHWKHDEKIKLIRRLADLKTERHLVDTSGLKFWILGIFSLTIFAIWATTFLVQPFFGGMAAAIGIICLAFGADRAARARSIARDEIEIHAIIELIDRTIESENARASAGIAGSKD